MARVEAKLANDFLEQLGNVIREAPEQSVYI